MQRPWDTTSCGETTPTKIFYFRIAVPRQDFIPSIKSHISALEMQHQRNGKKTFSARNPAQSKPYILVAAPLRNESNGNVLQSACTSSFFETARFVWKEPIWICFHFCIFDIIMKVTKNSNKPRGDQGYGKKWYIFAWGPVQSRVVQPRVGKF